LHGSDRWRALAGATVLALPSSWPEPFGLVGLEAGALGIPAVAFDVGGVREWLRPGINGCLAAADPPRSETFAAALVDAFGDETRLAAMGARAIEVAREMSLGRHLDALESIFFASVGDHAQSAGR
jgi:glycosyltransferase involved in cell wall biosynthesis